MAITDAHTESSVNPINNTPSIIQDGFGAYGQDLPGDGLTYCGPTAALMGIYWPYANGFTQLAPTAYDPDDLQSFEAALNLEQVLAGLMNTSVDGGGTGRDMFEQGVQDYFAARGIGGSDPVPYTTSFTDAPDLQWFAAALTPNVTPDSDVVTLAVFGVAWYVEVNDAPLHRGGHFLTPLIVEPVGGNWLMLNNPFPASFFDVPNIPSSNPQTVVVAATTPPLPFPSPPYCQIVTPTLGTDRWAVLTGGYAWAINRSACPPPSGYDPQPWQIDTIKTINTNGGQLEVLAQLQGAGGLAKTGAGTLLLANTNALTGAHSVIAGTLASSQTAGTPFGTGAMTLTNGGVLMLEPGSADAVVVDIAPSEGVTLESGGGSLALYGTNKFQVKIGGLRTLAGRSLAVVPYPGIAQLGNGQNILIDGYSEGIVPAYILGLDTGLGCGKFLTYGSAIGLSQASTVLSTTTPIGKVAPGDLYQVVDEQAIPDGGTVTLVGLEVDAPGAVLGPGGTVVLSGAHPGVILNGADTMPAQNAIIETAIRFADSEGVLYASAGRGALEISGNIWGSDGLTIFGPGTVMLSADNSSTLTGPITINEGALVSCAPGGSGTGASEIIVQGTATLELSGIAPSAVTVAEGATLNLTGGTVRGSLSIAPAGTTSPAPGGILQGHGTIEGQANVGGQIQAGDQTGMLEFQNMATTAGANFFWQLQQLVDDDTTQPQLQWNTLRYDQPGSTVGSEQNPLRFFLDFSKVGEPDPASTFWQSPHKWTVFLFETRELTYYVTQGNFHYSCGKFELLFRQSTEASIALLVWIPASSVQSWAQQQITQAEQSGKATGEVT
ncbi:autotransporter-associated beta strand protein [Mycobacterium sp. OAS707]|uniref:hypothetical protein n=1 Tax=Mycobacterium sp. OAS707 TaxID=2663822 RepID=UPI001789D8BA|nr:hypothetical protein [Mycobacterium sp. OAS707]MBE1552121.1 autotransporter-associated beta strand protein [Mycobacterium sp. OAS707]